MSIIEILLSGVLLLISAMACFITLSMDKEGNRNVITGGMSAEMKKNRKKDIKHTKDKIAVVCLVLLLLFTFIAMVLVERGVM